MGDTNQRTLNAYRRASELYTERSPQEVRGFLKDWIDTVFADLSRDTRILEIGSAGGRDADYIEGGFGFTHFDRSDAVPEFVEMLRRAVMSIIIFSYSLCSLVLAVRLVNKISKYGNCRKEYHRPYGSKCRRALCSLHIYRVFHAVWCVIISRFTVAFLFGAGSGLRL